MVDLNRFPVLSFVSKVFKFLGWLLVAIGLIAMIMAFIGGGRVGGLGALEFALIALLAGVVNGLVLVAIGEAIGVLFAIEANTRLAAGARAE